MTTREAIIDAFIDVGNSYKNTNELAYLALTGKVERPIQNRLAFCLHEKLFPTYVVVLEWNKFDIAVFRGGENEPHALIELKAMVNFNGVPKTAKRFTDAMLQDEKDAREWSQSAEVYSILLTSHPKSAILPELKYFDGIRNAYKNNKTHDAVIEQTLVCLDNAFGDRDVIVRRKHFAAGEAFGVDVDIHYCVVKAPSAIANWRTPA